MTQPRGALAQLELVLLDADDALEAPAIAEAASVIATTAIAVRPALNFLVATCRTSLVATAIG